MRCAVRVEPEALAVRNIGLDEVSCRACARPMSNTPVGTLEGPQPDAGAAGQQAAAQCGRSSQTSSSAAEGGNPVRLRDVAKVEDSLETLKS